LGDAQFKRLSVGRQGLYPGVVRSSSAHRLIVEAQTPKRPADTQPGGAFRDRQAGSVWGHHQSCYNRPFGWMFPRGPSFSHNGSLCHNPPSVEPFCKDTADACPLQVIERRKPAR